MRKIKIESSGHGMNTKIFVDDTNISSCVQSATLKWSIESLPILELQCPAINLDADTDAVVLVRELKEKTPEPEDESFLGVWTSGEGVGVWVRDGHGEVLHWPLNKRAVAEATLRASGWKCSKVAIILPDGSMKPLPKR